MADAISLDGLAGKTSEEVFAALRTSAKGLSTAEAAARLKIYGLNEFAGKKHLQPLFIFLSKFRNPLQILLIAAAIVSGILGSHIEAIIILVIVFGSAFIDFFNTYKSAKAAEALQEKVTITAAVMRDGSLKERNMREVVPGDVFTLEAGDLVPADAIVLEAKDLIFERRCIDGGVVAGGKIAEPSMCCRQVPTTASTVFLGTSVVSGKGIGGGGDHGRAHEGGQHRGQAQAAGHADGVRKKPEGFQSVYFPHDVLSRARRHPSQYFRDPA